MKRRSGQTGPILFAAAVGGAVAYAALRGTSSAPPPPPAPSPSPAPQRPSSASAQVPAKPPALLYLPDGGDLGPATGPGAQILPGPGPGPLSQCPAEMVLVAGAFCIDRWETSLVDPASRAVSPHYHPRHEILKRSYGRWRNATNTGETQLARTLAVPAPADWQLAGPFEVRAQSRPGVLPNGYLSRTLAEAACESAGKRLCSEEEWVRACRGQEGRQFPYGEKYEHGRCNVFREAHPAQELHGNASINHTDPRLNRVAHRGRPLLRKTGETPHCVSRWGQDAIHDMVGNLDEWVADPDGVFVGGFYSRSTRAGCESKVSSHAPSYFDYSLGTRCCRSL